MIRDSGFLFGVLPCRVLATAAWCRCTAVIRDVRLSRFMTLAYRLQRPSPQQQLHQQHLHLMMPWDDAIAWAGF